MRSVCGGGGGGVREAGKGGSENVGTGSSTPVIFQKVGVGPRQGRIFLPSPLLCPLRALLGESRQGLFVLATPP